jgi:hypothetical protein
MDKWSEVFVYKKKINVEGQDKQESADAGVKLD